MPTKGISAVKRKYRVAIGDIAKAKTYSAIYAILSQGGAVAATLTPIDTSNLVNSQYAPQIRIKDGHASGNIGYTAKYAFWVHEMSGKLKGQPRAHFGKTGAGVEFGGGSLQGTYWSPNAEPGFLEKGFKEIIPSIPAILKRAYQP